VDLFLVPQDVVARVERHGWALHPDDAAAEFFLFAVVGAGGDDDHLVAQAMAGLELLVDVGLHPATLLGVELRDVDDLHGAVTCHTGNGRATW